MSETTGSETPSNVVLARSLKLAGEALVSPGASLLLDGDLGAGSAHVLGGILARMVLGPVGWALVAANSYSRSVTGKGLLEHLQGEAKTAEPGSTATTNPA